MNKGRFRTPNPEVWHASTVLFDSMAHHDAVVEAGWAGDRDASAYATLGTPTTRALETLLLEGEGGAGVELSPSGLAAITVALLGVLRAGDHLLMTDSVYEPARNLADGLLARLGIETEYYDPLIGGGIASLIRPTTRAIWVESPGSYTMEVQDLPAIAAAARAADHDIATICDNTYGSPGIYAPLALGADVVTVALTKYWSGHSDLVMGATFANERWLPAIRDAVRKLGICGNGDDAFLVARGARTTALRIAAHAEAGLEIANRLAAHPRVGRVLHPSLPDTPGHATFVRDFSGPNGLLSFELLARDGSPADRAAGRAFVDRLAARGRFGIGYSWGGWESLVVPAHLIRVVRPWEGGALIRIHVGLEAVETLWGDLEAALAG